MVNRVCVVRGGRQLDNQIDKHFCVRDVTKIEYSK